MEKVLTSEKRPIKLWLDDIEDGALEQAKNLSNLPFAFKHIAIMPDSHQGYGMPIGGVLATRNVVVPNAVGVDIGCGMCAVKTDIKRDLSIDEVKEIIGKIREAVPVGFNHHDEKQEWEGFKTAPTHLEIVEQEIDSARYQIGTLGGGNHFIELQRGDDGHLWVMLHSGSRNIGFKIANHYHNLAKEHCKKWHSDLPDDDLAFLPMDTQDGKDYIEAMNFALKFAKENRFQMLDKIAEIIGIEHFIGDVINIHHNYASMEHHFGQNVMVHRKGATRAYEGQLGIIPGSQGTSSYIVEGKGNTDSFKSCSHGAGRNMSRTQARKELSVDEEKKRMEGIVHAVRGSRDLDEAPSAYKDITEVMKRQEDLVSIKVKLTPLGVVKG